VHSFILFPLAKGATWFDLSPANVERKLGSKGEIAKLVHMVFKVAEEMQPSVIYIDDVDKVWAGAKGKKHVTEVVKMKNYIMQHKSGLKKDKRILVIGNSRIPYGDKVDSKDLKKFFSYKNSATMLYTPAPGYSTRLKLWRYFISQTGLDLATLERNPKFDLTTLSYISGAPKIALTTLNFLSFIPFTTCSRGLLRWEHRASCSSYTSGAQGCQAAARQHQSHA